mmetsp:Transcript_10872/g.13135  ORF Transcript_10872/g.13135 Transcript_10872/m.13135 type:complete len:275 (+) Transcript_10872:208-1032(+)|eukprot:CAMPEP_0184048800 /NCGR_PEP_ID=MMETSP0956-20121227/3024_1 /TAXON_ID=627963 /ORGANISM="Aplanochytrium sp, Strain PBS07" /LENGTH=274 /DNA_ID=CAMNT_0026340957 /DNA_START=115 /DNA_END=939 /DNA_ORIENTATION=-
MAKRGRNEEENDDLKNKSSKQQKTISNENENEEDSPAVARLEEEDEEDDFLRREDDGNSSSEDEDFEADDNGPRKKNRESQLKFGMVCSSNMNRSMEAHFQLEKVGLDVYSYGVGTQIRLPGPKGQEVFDFGTPYQAIKDTLVSGGRANWFRERGLLDMLNRNIGIKEGPERWQEAESSDLAKLDIVFCFEGRVFDLLIEDLEGREPEEFEPIHVLNLEVKDNAAEAAIGAQICLELCNELQKKSKSLEEELPKIVSVITKKYKREIMSKTCYI